MQMVNIMNITPRIDLGLLAVLVSIDDAGSVSQAAERLSISQPSVSHALKRLRELTGDELFIRQGGRLRRTAHAAKILPDARKVVSNGTRLLSPCQFDAKTTKYQFRFAATHYAIHACLNRLMPIIHTESPGAEASVTWVTQSVFEDILHQNVDFAFTGDITSPLIGDELAALEIFDESYVGVMCKNHPLAGSVAQGKLTKSEWLRYPHIRCATLGLAHSSVHKALHGLEAERSIGFQSPSHSLNIRMLSGSQFLYALPSTLTSMIDPDLHLTFDLPIKIPRYPFYLVYSKAGQATPALRYMRELIIDIMARS